MNTMPVKLKFWFGVIAVITLSSCAMARNTSVNDQLPAGWIESSIEFEGLTRWYRIYTPDPLPDKPALVLYLHGGTLSMRALFSPLVDGTDRWFSIAEKEGVVLLVPNGVNPKTGDTFGDDQNWNDLRPDISAGQTTVNDVGFLMALLDKVSEDLPIDENRIYVTGASNGGMMTYRLLMDKPDRFAAGAAFIANLPDLPDGLSLPERPTPLMIANGTEDPLMPWDGGVVAKDRGYVISADETVSWWVGANHADPAHLTSTTLPDLNLEDGCRVRVDYYPAGENGAPVLFYALMGGGHTMPSLNQPGLFLKLAGRLLGPVCQEVEGVDLAWDFFKELSDLP